jgi:1-acyl-sn-glycerol-3-phosphate acyltransferase
VATLLAAAMPEGNPASWAPPRALRAAGFPFARATGDDAAWDRTLAGNLASRAARLWRQVRLGSAFVEFALACLVVAFVVGPLLSRRARSAEEAELAVQRAIHRAFAFSVACWQRIRLIRVNATGLAGLAELGPCVIVANHPTLIDVVLLGSRLPQMDCIVNAGWAAHSPFLQRAIKLAGYVKNDAGQSAVDDCATRLARGRKVLVFPEGTRSPWGSFGKFQRGAAHIALATGAPVLAVTIRCRPRMLGSNRKWHDVPPRSSRYELRIAGRLEPAAYLAGGTGVPIAARRMTEDLRRIFLEEPHLADA